MEAWARWCAPNQTPDCLKARKADGADNVEPSLDKDTKNSGA